MGRRFCSVGGWPIYIRNLLSFTSLLIAGSVMLGALVFIHSSYCLHKLRFVRGDHCFLFIFVGKDQLLSLSRFQPKNCWRKGGHRHRQVRFYPLFCHSYNQSRWLFCGNLATFCRTIGSLTQWSNLKTSRPNSLSRVANVLA